MSQKRDQTGNCKYFEMNESEKINMAELRECS